MTLIKKKPHFFHAYGFLVILWVLFLLRGFLHLATLPTLEGFDSIGHIDYLQYLRDHDGVRSLGHMPFSSKTTVLLNTLPSNRNLRSYPLAANLNPKTYEAYFKTKREELKKLTEELNAISYDSTQVSYLKKHLNWQDKHPPTYYLVVNTLVGLFYPKSYMDGIQVARLVSLFMLSLTIPILFYIGRWIDGLIKENNIIMLSVLFPALFIAQPMIYIFACRISNDALAIPFNTLVISLLFIWIKFGATKIISWILGICIGIAIGLSIITKTYALLYFPAIPLLGVYLGWRHRSWLPIFVCVLIVLIALSISFPTLAYHQQTVHSIDGSHIGTLSIKSSVLETIITMYIRSIDGYRQLIRMLVVRLWIGNWSSLGNYFVVYCLYGFFFFALMFSFWKRRYDLFDPKKHYESDLLFFSLLIQILMIAALVNLGIRLYMRNPVPKNVAGYYTYAFYLSELVIIWQCLRNSIRAWPWLVIILFMIADVGGMISQILFYFGVAHIGPLKMVIPNAGWFTHLIKNWEIAPWVIISPTAFITLVIVYFVGLLSTMWAAQKISRNFLTSGPYI